MYHHIGLRWGGGQVPTRTNMRQHPLLSLLLKVVILTLAFLVASHVNWLVWRVNQTHVISLGYLFYSPHSRCIQKDVDLIVLDTESTLEEHKEFLVKENDQFYLLPSRKPNAPCRYRVLWYKTTRGSRVKIDVLQPGVMSVPDFMPSDIIWEPVPRHRLKIPMAPLGIVLLLKLLGWDEHRLSNIKRYNIKRYADADHIRGLLKLGLELVDYDYLPPEFLWKAQKRVYTFVYRYPHTKLLWHNLGFRVRRPLNYNRR